jgi:hypothetical protein
MSNTPTIFEQYQAGSLHEAGHAVIAIILGRKLVEISILRDQYGDGYVSRERHQGSPQEVLEELAITLAGVEAPYLWVNWVTNGEYDDHRVEELLRQCPQLRNIDWDELHSCLKEALDELSGSIGSLAHELTRRKKISGQEAEEIVACSLPQAIGLRECLASLLKRVPISVGEPGLVQIYAAQDMEGVVREAGRCGQCCSFRESGRYLQEWIWC